MPLSLKTNRSLCKKLLMAVILLAGLAQYTFADENREIGIAFIPDEKVKVTAGEKAQAELTLEFPGKSTLKLKLSSEDSFTIGETEFSISIPSGAPTNIVFMAHVVNRDLHWFQRVNRVHLQPGITNKTTVSFEPGAREWRPLGHHGGWNGRTMLNPREVAINLYSDEMFINKSGYLLIFITFSLHHMTPMTGKIATGNEQNFILLFCLGNCCRIPFLPIYWICSMHREIR